jgi:hypothetical protein
MWGQPPSAVQSSEARRLRIEKLTPVSEEKLKNVSPERLLFCGTAALQDRNQSGLLALRNF